MKKDLVVRTFANGDATKLRAILNMFGKAFDEHKTYGTKPPNDKYLNDLLARNTFVAVAAFSPLGVTASKSRQLLLPIVDVHIAMTSQPMYQFASENPLVYDFQSPATASEARS